MSPGNMDVVSFGRQLFDSADLDPCYVALQGCNLARPHLGRWLVAYFCFYHCGAASYLSEREGQAFWHAMMLAARNASTAPNGGRWPRGAERRNFRGAAATAAVEALRKRYGTKPQDMLDYLATGPLDVRSVIERARAHKLFGPWMGFKVADMLDAVWGVRVAQNDASVFLYATPRKSILENVASGQVAFTPGKDEQATLVRGMLWLQNELSDCRIPHRPDSAPDWFSLETVWCKHLSHRHGSYPLLNDTFEIRHGLAPWLNASETAQRFLERCPVAPLVRGMGRRHRASLPRNA